MTHQIFTGIAATAAALVAATIYQVMVGNALANDPIISLPGTALATLLVTWLCWGWFVSRPQRPTLKRGALTGLLISILAHPVAFLFTFWISFARNGPTDAGLIQDLLMSPVWAVMFSGLSLLITGIVTIPAGVAGGAALAYVQSKVVRDRES